MQFCGDSDAPRPLQGWPVTTECLSALVYFVESGFSVRLLFVSRACAARDTLVCACEALWRQQWENHAVADSWRGLCRVETFRFVVCNCFSCHRRGGPFVAVGYFVTPNPWSAFPVQHPLCRQWRIYELAVRECVEGKWWWPRKSGTTFEGTCGWCRDMDEKTDLATSGPALSGGISRQHCSIFCWTCCSALH